MPHQSQVEDEEQRLSELSDRLDCLDFSDEEEVFEDEEEEETSEESDGDNQNNSRSSLLPQINECFDKLESEKHRNMQHRCRHCDVIVKGNTNSRLMSHVKNCTGISRHAKLTIQSNVAEKFPNIDWSLCSIDLEWTEVLIAQGIPFAFSSSQRFRDFIAKHFKTSWISPSGSKISSHYVPNLGEKVRQEMEEKIKAAADLSLSIEFDHADLGSKSVLAILVTFSDGQRYLFSLTDASIDGKSAPAIESTLRSQLVKIPSRKINALVSDSASSCKKARDAIVFNSDLEHAMSHRCLAHLLNLVIKKVEG